MEIPHFKQIRQDVYEVLEKINEYIVGYHGEDEDTRNSCVNELTYLIRNVYNKIAKDTGTKPFIIKYSYIRNMLSSISSPFIIYGGLAYEEFFRMNSLDLPKNVSRTKDVDVLCNVNKFLGNREIPPWYPAKGKYHELNYNTIYAINLINALFKILSQKHDYIQKDGDSDWSLYGDASSSVYTCSLKTIPTSRYPNGKDIIQINIFGSGFTIPNYREDKFNIYGNLYFFSPELLLDDDDKNIGSMLRGKKMYNTTNHSKLHKINIRIFNLYYILTNPKSRFYINTTKFNETCREHILTTSPISMKMLRKYMVIFNKVKL